MKLNRNIKISVLNFTYAEILSWLVSWEERKENNIWRGYERPFDSKKEARQYKKWLKKQKYIFEE
jgi:hypothetical protein